jgi:ribosome modulation factor
MITDRTAKAFERGRAAYSTGKAFCDNPYTHETTIQSANHWAWSEGWKTALKNDPLIDHDERDELLHRH